MNFAAIVHSHCKPDITKDTIDSVKTYATKDIVCLIDGASWDQFDDLGVEKIKGEVHAHKTSPYRNQILGLKELYNRYPDKEWYWHLEYDTLLLTNGFKTEINKLKNIWVAGCDYRMYDMDYPAIEDMIGDRIKASHYFIGCCQFYHNDFVSLVVKNGTLDSITDQTKMFKRGYFPTYKRYSFDEELLPTLAVHLGGKAHNLCTWSKDKWDGNGVFRVRYRPIIYKEDILPHTSVIHPSKDDDEIRLHYRKARLNFK